MYNRTRLIVLAGIAALAVGCSTAAEDNAPVVAGTSDTKKITLTKGDTFSVAVEPSGDSTVTVRIAAGKPDAGTYTTTSDVLLDPAHDASSAIGKRGASVWIHVDGKNKITGIGNGQTMD